MHRSPFDNVNLSEYSPELRSRVFYAAEVLLAEIRHLRSYLTLFLDFYRQRVSSFTQKKLKALVQLVDMLRGGEVDKFFRCDENEFYVFFNANRRLDRLLGSYFKNFKALVDIDADPAVIEQELDNWGRKITRVRRCSPAWRKKLRRCALVRLTPAEELKYIGIVAQIYEDIKLARGNTQLSANFTDRGGRLNFRRRGRIPRTAQTHARPRGERVHGLQCGQLQQRVRPFGVRRLRASRPRRAAPLRRRV